MRKAPQRGQLIAYSSVRVSPVCHREHAPRGRSARIEPLRQPQLDVEPGACVRRRERQLELDLPSLDQAIGGDPDGRFG